MTVSILVISRKTTSKVIKCSIIPRVGERIWFGNEHEVEVIKVDHILDNDGLSVACIMLTAIPAGRTFDDDELIEKFGFVESSH